MTHETERMADAVARAGITFGARFHLLMDAAEDALAVCGRGIKAKEENEQFEMALEAVTDQLRWDSDDAKDLFAAEARLQFYNDAAPATIRKYREKRDGAFFALAGSVAA